ncbi:ras-related and estrogen-regulated growth inhibitor [Prorops nasuta]|uniref:ras-related and estrogen-regulated growth inhibitor n=1 Tax=Prorops nasuta TaxID=863751 RepID=UPI0034CD9D94
MECQSSGSTKRKNNSAFGWSLGLSCSKDSGRTIRVILLGQPGVGKTALAVRFATKRFIGEYDGSTERIYKVENILGSSWEITDPPGLPSAVAEPKLRWADAIVLVYSVTDRVSFDETSRLRFLVSHARKDRKVPPVVLLIGNKADLTTSPGERMVSTIEGEKRAEEIEAHSFHEISVRESVDQVMAVFMDTYKLLAELSNSCGHDGNCFRSRACTDGAVNTLRRPSPLRGRRLSISARGALY